MFKKPLFAAGVAAVALLATGRADAQQMDELNGVWTVTLDGKAAGTALTESYAEIGVRLTFDGKSYTLTHTGDTLTLGDSTTVGIDGKLDNKSGSNDATQVNLTVKGMGGAKPNPSGESLEGTFFGKQAIFKRDVSEKPPINLKLPGDRPWVRFMREILIPKTAEDRENYHKFHKTSALAWLKSTQLGAADYWVKKGWFNGDAGFSAVVNGMDGVMYSPRSIRQTKFAQLILANMPSAAKASSALILSEMSLYFATAGGGAVRIHVTDNDDSIIYYITDGRANNRIGLCVMATPMHKPLASSFGKWQNDAGNMQLGDDDAYARAQLETLCKSSTASMNDVKSKQGRSAFTDYLGIMAIEDQRGVMFNQPDLGWGQNMTQASFLIMIIRALSHGDMRQQPTWDATKKAVVLSSTQEPASQVIIGTELRPGTPSYIDTLNGAEDALTGGHKGGNDCQIDELAVMKTLATSWLRAEHAEVLNRLEKALAPFGAQTGADDVFQSMCDVFYDADHFSGVTTAQATEIVDAGVELFKTLRSDSKAFEAYILSHGYTKSDQWAPRAAGF
jgi:hypothetical protein